MTMKNFEAVLTHVGAKISALRNAWKLYFEGRIDENDAQTLAYEVAAAARPPLRNTFIMVNMDTISPVNGVYGRCGTVGAFACFFCHLSGKRWS